jgi:hypothetical protein
MLTTEAAEISLHSPGVLLIRFRAGIGLEPGHVAPIVSAARRLAGSTVHGNLVDVRGLLYIEQEAREAFAAERSSTLSAIAILLNSPLHRTLTNVYLAVSRPAVPTRMFTDEAEAIRWLGVMNGTHPSRR